MQTQLTSKYNLAYKISAHTKDVRTLDIYQNILVSGGTDNVVNIFSKNAFGVFQEVSKLNIFDSYIYSIKINPFQENDQHAFVVGCKDSKIYVLDKLGNPLCILQGHQGPVNSLVFYNKQTLLSGSWDGSLNVWAIKYKKIIKSLKSHSHAVAVFCDKQSKLVITGSQDKSINLWEFGTWKLLKKITDAHGDIIRQISKVQGVGFITCSNDQTVKVWTYQGDEVAKLSGHSGFVFTVKSKGFGDYISGGDDKTLRIWGNQGCIQIITHPSSIWSVVIDNNGDLITAGSDGEIYVFTTDISRKADQKTLDLFNNQCIKASSKKSGLTPQQISKLPPVQKMALHRGKKQGQIKIFKQNNIPMAYSWKTTKWQKIGEVITQGSSQQKSQQRRFYQGDKYFPAGQYDYIFDVDDESGYPKLIPFNDGENALQYAEKYCIREGLSKGYIQQIRKFLTQNSKNIKRQTMQVQNQGIDRNSPLQIIFQSRCIQFVGLTNTNGLKNKLWEFNEQVPQKQKLNPIQKGHLQRIIALLQKSEYHTWTLDFKELDAYKKILDWPQKFKLPVWDILRAYLNHYQSETFFSGLEAGMDILGPLCIALATTTSQVLGGLVLRIFCNMFIQNTNKYAMIKNSVVIISNLEQLSGRGFSGKNFKAYFSALLYNYSIGFVQKVIQKQEQGILFLLRLIQKRLEIDNEEQNQYNYLVAAGNIVFKYPNLKSKCLFCKKYYGGNPISRDLQKLI